MFCFTLCCACFVVCLINPVYLCSQNGKATTTDSNFCAKMKSCRNSLNSPLILGEMMGISECIKCKTKSMMIRQLIDNDSILRNKVQYIALVVCLRKKDALSAMSGQSIFHAFVHYLPNEVEELTINPGNRLYIFNKQCQVLDSCTIDDYDAITFLDILRKKCVDSMAKQRE